MKRYISLALTAVVLICSLSFPSYAAEVSNDTFINVFDYLQYDPFVISANEPYTYRFDLPVDNIIYYVDFIFLANNGMDSVKLFGSDMTLVHLSGDLYRAYGQSRIGYDYVELQFLNHYSTWIYPCALNVSYNQNDKFNAEVLAKVGFQSSTTYLSLNRNDSYPTSFNFNGAFPSDCQIDFQLTDWEKYDYIDFIFYLDTYSISSLNASIDGIILPLHFEQISVEGGNFNEFYYYCRLDLSGIKRTLSFDPIIKLTFDSKIDDNINTLQLVSCNGYVSLELVKPLPFLFDSLFSKLGNWFSSLNSSVDSWGQQIVDSLVGDSSQVNEVVDQMGVQADQVQQNNDALQQLQKPVIDPNTSDITGIVSPSNTVKYTLFLTRIMNAPILADVIMLAMIFSLAAYVLFGKR